MRVLVIGGTGHIGTYLCPMLVEAGHQVVCLSRGGREPYSPHSAWASIERVAADRAAEDANGAFPDRVAALRPDVVVDLICFRLESAVRLAESLRGRVRHLLHCGTIWVHGHSTEVPTTEERPRAPFCEYGRAKARIEDYLLGEARAGRLPATVLHPGHIVGRGWPPLNPAGHFDPAVFAALARGDALALPNLGMETVHHVHAEDVAQAFARALERWSASVGESFHVVSPAALTLRGYAEGMAAWFGRQADLRFLPWERWRETVAPEAAAATWDHIAHSPCCSIEKGTRLLGYAPRHTSLSAVRDAVDALLGSGALTL
ncbi:MAG: NAD-dependent epimerase/dehydratase family protein [Chthonomonadales bacterium]|nr:NAD-dependent epimerase/dehydratase family protein [Chthonomonadales bacterium]